MINSFRVQGYKALRDVELALTPMHVLIGPNDSGKTSILEAITALCRSVDHKIADSFLGRWQGIDLVWRRQPGSTVSLGAVAKDAQGRFEYDLNLAFQPGDRAVQLRSERAIVGDPQSELPLPPNSTLTSRVFASVHQGVASSPQVDQVAKRVHDALGGVHLYRWDTNLLAMPNAPDAARRFRMDRSGFGLALVLDDILGYDRRRFDELESRFCGLFPQVRSIKLISEPAFKASHGTGHEVPMLHGSDGKGIHFELSDGTVLRASQASDGLLLVLAYLAVLYLPEPPRVLLIEEPENGIHPKRLEEVLKILRELVADASMTQVILTTHSPYVLDHFTPEEVTLCQKGADGAVTTRRLSESELVRREADVFTLGEIWTGEGDEALTGASPVGHAGTGVQR